MELPEQGSGDDQAPAERRRPGVEALGGLRPALAPRRSIEGVQGALIVADEHGSIHDDR